MRGFFRLVGLLLLAGGFIFVVYDGARWVADQNLRFTRFGQFWNDIHQSSQQAFRAWVEGNVPWLWNSVVKVVLDQPVFAVMGVLGILLMIFTPLARVVLSFLSFAEERDRTYVAVTAIVLLNLLVSVFLLA